MSCKVEIIPVTSVMKYDGLKKSTSKVIEVNHDEGKFCNFVFSGIPRPGKFGAQSFKAFLRLINGPGHDWALSGSLYVTRKINDLTPGDNFRFSKCYMQRVFRIPEWQPTWFIDITDMIYDYFTNHTLSDQSLELLLSGRTDTQQSIFLLNRDSLGFKPSIILTHCFDSEDEIVTENNRYGCRWKIDSGLNALQKVYTERDLSWSGSFVRNAQANMHRLTADVSWLTVLKNFWDSCITSSGKLKRISESCFYVGTNANSLIYLYEVTQNIKYFKAINQIKDLIIRLDRTQAGIIMADDRVEAELIYCVCVFLINYANLTDDQAWLDLGISQAERILDLLFLDQADGIPLQNPERPFSKGWSRGMGWIAAGLAKILRFEITRKHPARQKLEAYFRNFCHTLLNFQDETGMFRSIIFDLSKPYEVTGSCLIASGFAIGVQCDLLDATFSDAAFCTLRAVSAYSKTGVDMSSCFPMNFHEYYDVTDFSGISDQGFGTWMELYTIMRERIKNDEEA